LITTQNGQQPADFTDVRATNLTVVLAYVRANAPCSRADIAAATGLNKATVSSLVGELIDRRLLRETGLTARRIGRPATMIVVDGSPYAAIGLEVGTDHLAAVAVGLAGERLLSWRRTFTGRTSAPNKATATLAGLARRALNRMREEGRQVLGLAVAAAGLVDEAGVVRVAANLGWRDVPLRDALLHALGEPAFPISVDNEANLAARAEHRYGPHAGTANLVYVSAQAGIGAGIISDGRPVRGGRGFAGELGHLAIDPAGPRCGCGRRGCLETVAGVAALVHRLQPDSAGTDLEPHLADVVRRARAQEPEVLAALHDTGTRLGFGLTMLANLVNPEVIILGGYFVPLAPWLLRPAQAELNARVVAPGAGGCRLVASALGQDAAAVGGAASVLDDVDAGRLPLPA
jgi:predicted NBD/HSP70 family sugar kinase